MSKEAHLSKSLRKCKEGIAAYLCWSSRALMAMGNMVKPLDMSGKLIHLIIH